MKPTCQNSVLERGHAHGGNCGCGHRRYPDGGALNAFPMHSKIDAVRGVGMGDPGQFDRNAEGTSEF